MKAHFLQQSHKVMWFVATGGRHTAAAEAYAICPEDKGRRQCVQLSGACIAAGSLAHVMPAECWLMQRHVTADMEAVTSLCTCTWSVSRHCKGWKPTEQFPLCVVKRHPKILHDHPSESRWQPANLGCLCEELPLNWRTCVCVAVCRQITAVMLGVLPWDSDHQTVASHWLVCTVWHQDSTRPLPAHHTSYLKQVHVNMHMQLHIIQVLCGKVTAGHWTCDCDCGRGFDSVSPLSRNVGPVSLSSLRRC